MIVDRSNCRRPIGWDASKHPFRVRTVPCIQARLLPGIEIDLFVPGHTCIRTVPGCRVQRQAGTTWAPFLIEIKKPHGSTFFSPVCISGESIDCCDGVAPTGFTNRGCLPRDSAPLPCVGHVHARHLFRGSIEIVLVTDIRNPAP